jgi:hypothetical protein
MLARAGTHRGEFEYALVNRVPDAANPSRFGERMKEAP